MNSVIIVEGIHDEMKIKEVYPEAFVVTTNGSQISKETLDLVQMLSKKNQIIVFTDPDYPGERIRNMIEQVVPDVMHAFLRKKDAISKNKKKVGIEHASHECIIDSLSHLYKSEKSVDTITNEDLFELGLNGQAHSRVLREKISLYFNIGRPNAKTFLKRINMLKISKEELKKLCQM